MRVLVRRLRFIAAVVAVVVGVLGALAACSSASGAKAADLNDQSGTGTYQGFAQTPPLPRPSFTLTDTQNQPYSFGSATAGHPTLLYFGYTECPDVCPTTMADIGNAIRQVPSSLQSKVVVVFVTTDVKHDTPAVIASWLAHFDTGLPNQFVGLSGTQDQIDAAQAAAKVMLAEDNGQQHSATVTLYGSDDFSHVTFAQSTNLAGQIAHDLKV